MFFFATPTSFFTQILSVFVRVSVSLFLSCKCCHSSAKNEKIAVFESCPTTNCYERRCETRSGLRMVGFCAIAALYRTLGWPWEVQPGQVVLPAAGNGHWQQHFQIPACGLLHFHPSACDGPVQNCALSERISVEPREGDHLSCTACYIQQWGGVWEPGHNWLLSDNWI